MLYKDKRQNIRLLYKPSKNMENIYMSRLMFRRSLGNFIKSPKNSVNKVTEAHIVCGLFGMALNEIKKNSIKQVGKALQNTANDSVNIFMQEIIKNKHNADVSATNEDYGKEEREN